MPDQPATAAGTERPANQTAPSPAPPAPTAPGRALATTGDAMNPLAVSAQDAAALSDDQRQQIALRKNRNIVTAKLAGTNWGKGMDDGTRRAVAEWGERNGIDVTTEIHVLGGNIYLNAQFYLNRLVGLLHRGLVTDYRQEFIQPDPRLDAIITEKIPDSLPDDLKALALEDRRTAFEEKLRRRRLRIEHGAPDTPPSGILPEQFAIGVTTITLAAMPASPIRGVKWAPHAPRDKDPVGAAYPQETALTRSSRRALKQCVTHIPELARWVDGSEDDAIASVAVAVREHEHQQRRFPQPDVKRIGATAVPRADYLEAERDDVTRIRGPVSVTPAPASAMSPEVRATDTAIATGDERPPSPSAAESIPDLEQQLGPTGTSGHPDEDFDDLELLTADERREQAERERHRSGK